MAQLTAEHMSPASLRVGVDLVRVADVATSIARFGDAVHRASLHRRASVRYCDATVTLSPAERFAARFAAKEATLKVLRPTPTGRRRRGRSIEVRQLRGGSVRDRAARRGAHARAS